MKTNLLIKHDYLTLSVVGDNKLRMNFTVSRSGHRVSGSGPWTKESFEAPACAFMDFTKKVRGETPGQYMENLKAKALEATDFPSLTQAMSR